MTIKVRRGDNILETIVSAIINFFETYEKMILYELYNSFKILAMFFSTKKKIR